MRASILKIEASAGAGKTFRLTKRLLELMAILSPGPQALRSLVAITFTNKAAAEMKERLIRALKEIALKTPLSKDLTQGMDMSPETAAKWLETIFQHYQDLQIRTIDSLVFGILKGVALELGLRPDLEAELKEDILLERAYDQLLLALGQGDRSLSSLFRQVLFTYLEIESRGGFNPERGIRRTLLELFRYEAKGQELCTSFDVPPLKEKERQLKEKAQAFLDLVKAKKGVFRYSKWANYFKAPLENLNNAAFWKNSAKEVLKYPKDLGELETYFQEFRKALEEYLLTRAIGRLIPYTRIYEYLVKELETLRQREGIIHGGAWVSLVEKVLRENGVPLVYCKLGVRFAHFLMDEFQDTSEQQWAALQPLIVECLSKGGSFTYVGDTKQAIYVWRGGKPELFNTVPQELPGVLLEEHLPYNWRSRKELVDFNNTLFSKLAQEETAFWVAKGLLYGQGDKKKALTCPFVSELVRQIKNSFSRAPQKIMRSGYTGGSVRLFLYQGETSSDRDKKILALLTQHLPELFSRYREEKGDIAVLVRTNEQAEEVARLLFSLKIPAVTENALRLAGSHLIRALIALLTFLDYPYHDIALAGFLRSPIVQGLFSAEEFFAKRHHQPLIEALKARDPLFWQRYLSPLLTKAGILSPYDLVREIIARFDILGRFPEEKAFLYRFLSLVLSFEQEGGGLSAFLEHWHQRGLEERLGLPEEIAAVKVLTIHAAKGLEFETVVLPYIHWELRPQRLLTLADGRLCYAYKPYAPIVHQEALRQRCLQALEALNLLYVAFTRARKELLVYVPEINISSRSRRFGTGHILYHLLQETGLLEEAKVAS